MQTLLNPYEQVAAQELKHGGVNERAASSEHVQVLVAMPRPTHQPRAQWEEKAQTEYNSKPHSLSHNFLSKAFDNRNSLSKHQVRGI